MLTNLTGYRTYIVSFVVAMFGVLEMTDWSVFFEDPRAGTVAVVAAVIMAFMRSITTTPPGEQP